MGVNVDEISFVFHYTIEKCRKIDSLHFIQLSTLGFHGHGEKDLKCDNSFTAYVKMARKNKPGIVMRTSNPLVRRLRPQGPLSPGV